MQFVVSSLLFLAAGAAGFGCSWDYLIWMIRDNSADPYYRFVQSEKAGYIDRSGKIVIRPKFEVGSNNYGGQFFDGLMEIGVSDGKYVDVSGKVALDIRFYRGWDFSEGLAAAMPHAGGKWGYIDKTGRWAISPRFDTYPHGYVWSFSEGLAKVKIGHKIGYIDRSGEFVIPPRFLEAGDFSDGMARVVVEGPCMYIPDGPCPEFWALPRDTPKSADLPLCEFAFIDRSGAVITTQRFASAGDFSEGLAPVSVRSGEKWGYINKEASVVIPPRFDFAQPFSDQLAVVKQAGLWGYVDRTGKLVIPFRFQGADDFQDGLAPVTDGRMYWYINRTGNRPFMETFRLASHFFRGLAHVQLQGGRTFAYIDTTGRHVFKYRP